MSIVRNIDSNHLVGRWMGGFVTVTDINRVNIARKVRSHIQYWSEMFIYLFLLYFYYFPPFLLTPTDEGKMSVADRSKRQRELHL